MVKASGKPRRRKKQKSRRRRFKTGAYTSVKTGETMQFRSSYEERLMHCLDADDGIVTYSYERVTIHYRQGILVTEDTVNAKPNIKYRQYTPDFILTRSDNTRLMVEVKPASIIDTPVVQKKKLIGEQYCAMHGLEYKFMTLEDIVRYEKLLGIGRPDAEDVITY